jgi:hypothetical protein
MVLSPQDYRNKTTCIQGHYTKAQVTYLHYLLPHVATHASQSLTARISIN